MLPFAIRFALIAHLALITGFAVMGPDRQTLLAMPIAQFGALVAAGIIVHEITTTATRAGKIVRRWWRQRQERRRRERQAQPPSADQNEAHASRVMTPTDC